MKFLKENSYDILRLYINQIGITIFSLVLYFSVSMLEDKVVSLRLKVAISVFAMLFFFCSALHCCLGLGREGQDKNR